MGCCLRDNTISDGIIALKGDLAEVHQITEGDIRC
jgi:hypothetical protein